MPSMSRKREIERKRYSDTTGAFLVNIKKGVDRVKERGETSRVCTGGKGGGESLERHICTVRRMRGASDDCRSLISVLRGFRRVERVGSKIETTL